VGLGCEYIAIEKMPSSITALNIHPGILPYYKGVGNPEAWLRGDFGRMGVTIHRMTQRIDDGPIICQRSIAGMKRLNIPLSYLVAYKEGIDMLAVAVGKPHVGSSAPSKTPKPARVILWRMRISLFIIGTLKNMLLRSNVLSLHKDAHATHPT
jgi:hypothetical protein